MNDPQEQTSSNSLGRRVGIPALALATFVAGCYWFFSPPDQTPSDSKIATDATAATRTGGQLDRTQPRDDAQFQDNTLVIAKPPAPQEGYVGSTRCRECHLQVYDEYQQHPMAQSLFPVHDAPIVENYDDEISFITSARRRYSINKTAKGVFHHEAGLDEDEQAVYKQTVEVRYAMGSGRRGRSYVLNRDGRLYLSPIAWYSEGNRWDLAPGYLPGNHLRFSRQASERCLQCHAGRMGYRENTTSQGLDDHQYAEEPFLEHSIGCERCHGPGQAHIAHHRAGKPDTSDPIVNPEELESLKRDAICNQCHLRGEYQILRYGRGHGDFRPGQNIGDNWTVFVAPAKESSSEAVSHMQQLQQSRCFQQSGGRLGCISCHDAHAVPAEREKAQVYRDRCLKCHQDQGCALPVEAQRDSPAAGSCIACHMPRFDASDIPHTTQTDHRIPRRPHTFPAGSGGANPQLLLKIFDLEAVPLTSIEQNRAQGLIVARRAEEYENAELAKQAEQMLRPCLEAAGDDLLTLDALAKCCWLQGRVSEAVGYWERLLSHAPRDLQTIRSLMLVSQSLGRGHAAIEYAERYLKNDPWSASIHHVSAGLLAERGQISLAIERAERARTLDPSDLDVYRHLLALYQQAGDVEQVKRLTRSIRQLDGEIKEAPMP